MILKFPAAPHRLTVFWKCRQCGARGSVNVELAELQNLDQQIAALRDAGERIDHPHPWEFETN